MNPWNSESEVLRVAIRNAVIRVVKRLFKETGESFYYFTLITSGLAHAPTVAAWSYEKLRLVSAEDRELVKWSYADSPYFDFDSDAFEEVRAIFLRRPDILTLESTARFREYEERLGIMELALSDVDAAGWFGNGAEREKIVINVEVMPPDHSNTERALRLNPREALREWLTEAAE